MLRLVWICEDTQWYHLNQADGDGLLLEHSSYVPFLLQHRQPCLLQMASTSAVTLFTATGYANRNASLSRPYLAWRGGEFLHIMDKGLFDHLSYSLAIVSLSPLLAPWIKHILPVYQLDGQSFRGGTPCDGTPSSNCLTACCQACGPLRRFGISTPAIGYGAGCFFTWEDNAGTSSLLGLLFDCGGSVRMTETQWVGLIGSARIVSSIVSHAWGTVTHACSDAWWHSGDGAVCGECALIAFSSASPIRFMSPRVMCRESWCSPMKLCSVSRHVGQSMSQ